MNLILLEGSEIDERGSATLTDDRARHLLTVLKVQPGQTVRIGVVDGPLGTGRIGSVADRSVALECDLDQTPDRPRVDLLLALPRPKVLNRLWAQLSALGVDRVMLTNAARVERNYFDTHVLEPAHYRPLLVEGLQQARDTRLPRVSVHRQFRILMEDDLAVLSDAGCRIVADPSSNAPMRSVVSGSRSADRVLLAVGPEGGWNAFELQLLASHGFVATGMGRRTLRSDTACIALLAILHELLRETPPHVAADLQVRQREPT